MEEKEAAVVQGYISPPRTKFGAVETIQAVQHRLVTMGAPISASALEKFMANQEHDIINALSTQPSADVCLHKPSFITLKAMCCSLSLFNKQFHVQDLERCRIAI